MRALAMVAHLAALTVLVPADLVAQSGSDGSGIRTDALELQLGGRLHTQFNSTSMDGQPGSQLFIRRARIEVSMRITDRVSGAVHPEFGNDQVVLKDAYVEFLVAPGLALRAGNAYRPFGLLEQTSSKRILPVERGLRIRGLDARDTYAVTNGLGYSDRDVGLQLLGETDGGVEITAGVSRGPLHGSVGANASYQYAARVRGALGEGLRVGAGWSNRDFSTGSGAGLELARGNAFEVDLEYGSFAPGLHVLAEASFGDVDPFTDARFHGAQAWMAYRTEPGSAGLMLEPLLRVSYADVGVDELSATQRGGTLVTPGFALYFNPLNRIAVNYDLWWGKGAVADAQSFKVMFQLAF